MRVMVAIDDSEESFYALNWALDNLFRDMGAPPEASGGGGGSEVVPPTLLLVNVQQALQHYGVPIGPVGGAVFYPTVTVTESVKKAQEQTSATILSRALQMCKDKMVITEALSLNGNPKDEICQAIEQKHADLLIVGSRGLGKIKRAFLGSVSNYCAHHAKCPVLIVKSPKDHE
ncbi:hypothetical protein SLE2022_139250 [Rubroshorea leprosula]